MSLSGQSNGGEGEANPISLAPPSCSSTSPTVSHVLKGWGRGGGQVCLLAHRVVAIRPAAQPS